MAPDEMGARMALSDTAIRKAKAADRDYKLGDAGGLHLFVKTTGYKSWRFKYRFGGKEQRLVFGSYPDMGLAEARERRDEARRQIRDGRDPRVERMKVKAATLVNAEATFESVARRWHHRQLERWSPRYGRLVMFALERDIFPRIGGLPIRDVTGPIVLAALRAIEERGAIETAHRIRQQISAVLVFGISEGLIDVDVSATLAKGLLPVPKAQKFQAITDLDDLREFLREFEASNGIGPVVKLASRLLALTAVRPGVVAGALWSEFEGIDWTREFIGPMRPVWRISAERMKLDVDQKADDAFEHVLPLSRQAVDVLHAIRRETGRSPYVFPNARTWRRPLSGDAIRMAYRRLGYGDRHVPHGWRAAFSTIMNDRVKAAVKLGHSWRVNDRAHIDLMLAHVPKGMSASELRYNRSEHLADFHRLAQEWADALLTGQRMASDLMTHDR